MDSKEHILLIQKRWPSDFLQTRSKVIVPKQRHAFQERLSSSEQDSIPPTFQFQAFFLARFPEGLSLILVPLFSFSWQRGKLLHPGRRGNLRFMRLHAKRLLDCCSAVQRHESANLLRGCAESSAREKMSGVVKREAHGRAHVQKTNHRLFR